jgi:hypothetical protein
LQLQAQGPHLLTAADLGPPAERQPDGDPARTA